MKIVLTIILAFLIQIAHAQEKYSDAAFKEIETGLWKLDYESLVELAGKVTEEGPAGYSLGTVSKEEADQAARIAIKICDIAIAKNPNGYVAYGMKGDLNRHLGNNKQALSDYTKASAIVPDDGAFYHAKGKLKYEIGDYEGAIVDLTKAIDSKTQHFGFGAYQYWDSYEYRGMCYYETAKYNLALQDFDKMISTSKYITGWDYLVRGQSKMALKMTEQGCLDFYKAKEKGEKRASEFIDKYCR